MDILWSSTQTILPSIHDSHFLFEKFVYILYFLIIVLQELRVTVQFQINTVRIGIHSLLFIVSFVVLRQPASYYVVPAGLKLRFFCRGCCRHRFCPPCLAYVVYCVFCSFLDRTPPLLIHTYFTLLGIEPRASHI